MLLFGLSFFMLLMFFKSTNPLSSCLSLVLSLVIISPLLSLINLTWYVYLVNMLFVSGVFVLVMYITSSSSISLKYIWGSMALTFFMVMLPIPMMFLSSYSSGMATMFNLYNMFIFLCFILFLLVLIMFTSYMLMSSSALRNI